MKTALVCGAGGFIGCHLVSALKSRGYWVRGVDIKAPEFSTSDADEFLIRDLREKSACLDAVASPLHTTTPFDEVYQLAADMGGMGFIHSAECDIMVNSALINLHMLQASCHAGVGSYFFSSSACVYPDMTHDAAVSSEDSAYPAQPDNEYGWEKLYAERVALAFARNRGMNVHIARFQNCYGPLGTWQGGREKAPAALSRKVAEATSGTSIEVWGDGSAMRSYTYVDDMLEGIFSLVEHKVATPTNIGSDEFVSVTTLAETIIAASGKNLSIQYVEGPVGVQARNHSFEQIHALGWKATTSLKEGISETYKWVAAQVEAQK